MTDAAIAIPNLLYRYADAIDAGDLTGAARLFDHGVVWVGGQALRGEAALVAMWRGWMKIHPDGTPRTCHLVTNPIIQLEAGGAEASCQSRWTVLQATGSLPLQPIATGRYHDRFRLIDGEWRFVERRYGPPALVGDMREHLLKPIGGRDV